MMVNETEIRRVVVNPRNSERIKQLENWFRFEYVARLNKINRYSYWNIKCDDSRYALEKEAFEKENELRKLKGLELLPEPKLNKLL